MQTKWFNLILLSNLYKVFVAVICKLSYTMLQTFKGFIIIQAKYILILTSI